MNTYKHPQFQLNRLIQYGALAVACLMVISAPLQMMLTVLGAPGGFILSALLTVLLAGPVIMLTAVAPTVTVTNDALIIEPIIWKTQTIPWERIKAVKIFPLLPSEDSEVNRRLVVGKRNYKPAQGIMLLIPDLPPQYRIAGLFAGEGGQPVIALTNRAHSHYDKLVKAILNHTPDSIHDDDLFE